MTVLAPLLVAFTLQAGPQGLFDSPQGKPSQEVLAEVRIQGNLLTPDDQVV